jgi:hypothetical protein
MSSPAACSEDPTALLGRTTPLRVALIGASAWLESTMPPAHLERMTLCAFPAVEGAIEEIERFRPAVSVVLDPLGADPSLLAALPGLKLGLLVGGLPSPERAATLDSLDRIATFRGSLTGERVGGGRVWRAVPPPVADRFYASVRPLHGAPRTMSIGRSTEHREALLTPAKHHHDLLHAVHGVHGELLAELLAGCDVGVYVPPDPGPGFGLQVGLHLAAGQLLLTTPLSPLHGLEREIDYLQFDSPEGLVWMLDRIARFPEMHQRVRIRGRLKAEQYRASRVFTRLVVDFLADVRAFGRELLAPTPQQEGRRR